MASLAKEGGGNWRIHWKFRVRVGTRTIELIEGRVQPGRCTRAGAKGQLWEFRILEATDNAGTPRRGGDWMAGQFFGQMAAWNELGYAGFPFKMPRLMRAVAVAELSERRHTRRHLEAVRDHHKAIHVVIEGRSVARWGDPPFRWARNARDCIVTLVSRWLVIGFGIMLVPGCVEAPRPSLARQERGIVYILPGIDGVSLLNINMIEGLEKGGVRYAAKVHDWTTWTGSFGWLMHLTYEQRNLREAARFARIINRYQGKHPGKPVYVIGHSGGAGIALAAMELLSDDRPIDGLILLAAAVSPEHDLTAAMKRVRRGIWNFYSKADIGFLVVGTTVFGTIDRKHEPAAGAVGFRPPAELSEADAEVYSSKLFQVQYLDAMAEDGNYGTHDGWTRSEFVARWLAPLISNRPGPLAFPVAAAQSTVSKTGS